MDLVQAVFAPAALASARTAVPAPHPTTTHPEHKYAFSGVSSLIVVAALLAVALFAAAASAQVRLDRDSRRIRPLGALLLCCLLASSAGASSVRNPPTPQLSGHRQQQVSHERRSLPPKPAPPRTTAFNVSASGGPGGFGRGSLTSALPLTFVQKNQWGSWVMRGEHMARVLNASQGACESLGQQDLRRGVYIHVKFACREIMGRPGTVHILDMIDGDEMLQGFDGLIASTKGQIEEGRLMRTHLKNWAWRHHYPYLGWLLHDVRTQNAFCATHPCAAIAHHANLPCTKEPLPVVNQTVGIIGTQSTWPDGALSRAFEKTLSEHQLGRAAKKTRDRGDPFCSLMAAVDVAVVWRASHDSDKPCTRLIMSVLANRPTVIHSFYTCAAELKEAAPFRCGDAACARRVVGQIRDGKLNNEFVRLRREVVRQNTAVPAMYRDLIERSVEAARQSEEQAKAAFNTKLTAVEPNGRMLKWAWARFWATDRSCRLDESVHASPGCDPRRHEIAEATIKHLRKSGLHQLGMHANQSYARAMPFPHHIVDGLFPESILDKLDAEFPDALAAEEQGGFEKGCRNASARGWRCILGDGGNLKITNSNERQMGPHLQAVLGVMKSREFVTVLEQLTGISPLEVDPSNEGSGQHQIVRGGSLQIHADFNQLHEASGLHRRVNVFLYLNNDWQADWRGDLELWDRSMRRCTARIAPLRNRLVVFSTTDFSYHGHADPLNCPAHRSRRSLAVYYYSPKPAALSDRLTNADGELIPHSTLYQKRKCESCMKKQCRRDGSPSP